MIGRRTGVARDQVVLVDEQDRPLGTEAKLAAHQDGGKLHRAFSVFVFDSAGRMLIQRRAVGKYHFGGLWSNACCSHPQWDEDVSAGARQRLFEEFGIDVELRPMFTFVYRATDPDSGLTEHEFDHVFYATFDGEPSPDPREIGQWRWVAVADLQAEIRDHPERYTPWFRIAMEEIVRRKSAGSGS